MGKEYGILQILNRIFDYTNSLIRARLAGNVVSEVTLQNAATANGNGTPITLDGNASLVVQITGTFEGTINFEATQDGTNYVGILGQNVNTGEQVTSATAPGIFVFSVNGLNKFRARISGYTSGSITVKAAAIAVPLAGLSSATINATVDAVKVKDATGTYTWDIGSDGAGPVQLTGSTVTDSQAVPMTQAQKDIVARAVDNIIDTIGAENISVFLPLWETSGNKACDLLNRNLTFSVKPDEATGPTKGVISPFGKSMGFDRVNDYLVQNAVTENTVGNTDLALTEGTLKAAQKFAPVLCSPGFVMLNLKRVGTLSTAKVKVTICTDNAGVPGDAITNGETIEISCSNIDTTYKNIGFYFPNFPSLNYYTTYWCVLSYSDDTGVDGSNYICWQYETGGNTYQKARAYYDGSAWTVTNEENHVFGLFENVCPTTDASAVALFGTHALYVANQTLFSITGTSSSGATTTVAMNMFISSNGFYVCQIYDTLWRQMPINNFIKNDTFNILSFSSEYAVSTDKLKGYLNGKYVAALDGTLNSGPIRQVNPMIVGSASLTGSAFFGGWLGPIIITKNVLTASQMAKVAHNLLALRKYSMEV